jgi:hypothetical protein
MRDSCKEMEGEMLIPKIEKSREKERRKGV